MAFCTHCGAELDPKAKFCTSCGTQLQRPAPGKRKRAAPKNAKRPAQEGQTRRQAARKSRRSPVQKRAGPQVPDKFFPLVAFLFRQIAAAFFKQLPTVLFYGFLGWCAHTFLLVYMNEGFNPGTQLGQVLSLSGQTITGSLVWMVGSMLLAGLLARMKGKGSKVSLSQRISAMTTYLREAPMDAYSVLAGGVGIALVLATFVNSASGLVLAAGLGALIASKAGSVFSLLFRTAWNTIFSTLRQTNITRYGMAAGYLGVAASSAGMLANSLFPVGGLAPGAILLGAALVLGLSARSTGLTGFLVLGGGAAALSYFGSAGFLLADDGGWAEAGSTFSGWINSQGAIPAMLYGLGPAAGTGLGFILNGVLDDIADLFPEYDDWDQRGERPQHPPPPPPPPSSSDQAEDPVEENQNPPRDGELADPETGEPLLVNDGGYETGEKGQVWINGEWVDRDKAIQKIQKHLADNPLIDRSTGEPLTVNDGVSFEGGKAGQVWLNGKWVDRSVADSYLEGVDQKLDAEHEKIRQEQRDFADKEQQKRENKLKSDGYKFDEDSNSWIKEPAPEKPSATDQLNQRISKAADKISDKVDGDLKAKIDQLQKEGKYGELADVVRDYWGKEISANQAESERQQFWATAYGVGEVGAKATVAASRGALMVLGGPAGAAATAVSVGAVSAAQEGAETYVAGGSSLDVVKSTAAGFLSGAKDGVIGRYANMPAIGTATKVLLPAAGDTVETFVRTGDIKKSLQTGAISVTSELIGLKTDGLSGGLKKEIIGAGTSAAAGGALNVVNGGSFKDGAMDGLINHVGGKIGSTAGTSKLDADNSAGFDQKMTEYNSKTDAVKQGKANEAAVSRAQEDVSKIRQQTIDTEDTINQKIDVLRTQGQDPALTPSQKQDINNQIKDLQDAPKQADIINELERTKHAGTDAEGNPKQYVDTKQALEQLPDTAASRTAKQADPELRQAIIDTRKDQIYAPADQKTIERVSDKPEVKSLLQPGDKLVMDTFSTPGKPDGLGADRDARLVSVRESTDANGNKTIEKIEIPRKHWEKEAYNDFYDHSMNILGGSDKVTPETHPDFFTRKEELSYLKGEGLTQKDIDARAWGEANNQLFTDKFNVEASRDNSDQALAGQALRDAQGKQTTNIQQVTGATPGDGGKPRNLEDAEGFAKMWGEKSKFYEHNTPEALAQSQKGIEVQMKIRDSLRSQGLEPPPLDTNTAKAMELITRAPVGNDATPKAMEDLNKSLQDLGYKDPHDAMQKIASQVEGVSKWAGAPQAEKPTAPQPEQGLTSSGLSRVARNTLGPQENEEE